MESKIIRKITERTEAKGAAAFGTAAIIFLICEGCLMVCMDLRTLKFHIAAMKRNCVEGYLWLLCGMLCSSKKKQRHRTHMDGTETMKVNFEGD